MLELRRVEELDGATLGGTLDGLGRALRVRGVGGDTAGLHHALLVAACRVVRGLRTTAGNKGNRQNADGQRSELPSH
ncbi:hypothetical protein Aco03nite_020950 [Actinoplanes couchii]|uniref:Transposase n=1 Tax=Actinoplanes couchii TaxID=403638 RepID=A0ABQ3X594_9ACTN|nr:hypothetical protein Aco03nite_020950 [Actinoplanes couchii]